MAGDLDWLLAMNDAARRFGDGLSPSLEELLKRDERLRAEGVIPLEAPQASAGPVDQIYNPTQIQEGNVLHLPARQTSNVGKIQTR